PLRHLSQPSAPRGREPAPPPAASGRPELPASAAPAHSGQALLAACPAPALGPSVLAEFVSYYNQDRPRRSLGLEPPVPSPLQLDGEVISRPVLSGLHRVYQRVA